MRRSALALLAVAVAIFAFASIGRADAAGVVGTSAQRCLTSGLSAATVTHRAGLVVTHGDRHTETFCIEFSENTISGLEQLQRSGLPLITNGSGGLGSAVCSIGGEGSSDPTNCFASCTGGTCAYWAYYRYTDGAWKFSQVGASQATVHDGDIFGWSWGPGGNSSGTAPAPPGEICPNPTATATTMATSTAVPSTSMPAPTAAPATQAPVPSKTSVPPTIASSETQPDTAVPAASAPPATQGQATSAPAASPVNAVAGAAATPPASPVSSTTPVVTRTPTPKSGAIVIGEQQGKQNQAHSESQASGNGGSKLSLILFGIVVVGLIGAAGGITFWRRRAV